MKSTNDNIQTEKNLHMNYYQITPIYELLKKLKKIEN